MENDEYRIMREIEETYWWFLGRRHLLGTVFDRMLPGVTPGGRMLDIGCGTGGILDLSRSRGEVFGIDVSGPALRYSRERGFDRLARCDINRPLPFRDETFSLITCLDVLEHLEADGSLVKEMARICKPGGIALITVPAFSFLWSGHDEAVHHIRRYTRGSALRRLVPDCWETVKISYFNTALFLPILAARQIKRLFGKRGAPRSDFFIPLPVRVNRLLAALFKAEVSCLRFLNFPVGVSLLLILRRSAGEGRTP